MNTPESPKQTKVAVLGAGSWGTALALNCARLPEQQVYLWGHRPAHVADLRRDGENARYLPGFAFPDNVTPTDDLSVIYDCDMILLVVPSTAFAELLTAIAPYFAHQAIGWAIKGFDQRSNELLSETFSAHFPDRDYAVLAGPSFAKEVAAGLPTAVTIAGSRLDFASDFAGFIHNQSMRTYTTDDVVGAQIGGALKNVIAIAAGIADGLGFGANTRAALITRGLREISRIGARAGAQTETLMGLSGLGDLLLTCTDDLSRNRRFGLLLGQGKSVEEALATIGQTVEGLFTAKEARAYADKYRVHSPITQVVAAILYDGLSVQDAMQRLLTHQPKPESD
ncbi:MAG: glycerol-3-phosphate dehydrogenase [Gammaproteobacteria bacterium]|nr:MAG: glycerol-3-phosphate dehydrogenase [Gammaproteobacteria bacterium]